MLMRIKTAFLQILIRLGLFPLYILLHGYIMRLRGHLVYVSRLPDARGDFVCDGIHDEVQINGAIDYVSARGKGPKIIKLYGEFVCEGGVVISAKDLQLQGLGQRETTIIYTDSLRPITGYISKWGEKHVRVRRMY